MAYDPFRHPGGSTYQYNYNNNNNNGQNDANSSYTREEYRYADGLGAGPSTSGLAGGYDMDHGDNTYPPQPHMSQQPYQSYDMDPSMDQSMDHTMMGGPTALGNVGRNKEDEFDPFAPPPKSTGDLRMWRRDHRGHLWAKGSRPACIARFFCCSVMTVVLLVVSIILTLGIFLRPPDITFQGLAPIDSNTIQSSANSLNVSLGLQIEVANPNFFPVILNSITAKLVYPINNTQIGGGMENKIDFHSNSATQFTFPFMLMYSEAADPSGNVLKDLADKCGFIPGSIEQDITVDYTITISISIIGINIHPPFSGSASFPCPFSLADIKPLVAAFPALQGVLGPG